MELEGRVWRRRESWNSQAVSSSYHYIDNGYSRIIDIRSSASASGLLTLVPQVRGSNIPKGKLCLSHFTAFSLQVHHNPHGGILLRRRIPFEFSKNDVLNPELVGEWGAMEATKKMMQSCAQVVSVQVDRYKGMR